MAADFNQPTVSGEYTAIPGQIRDNFSAAVTMHESDSSSNKPTGAKQITADGNINRWNGSAWVGIAGGVPSGAISAFAGSSAPTGWLLCNGATVSQATYAALYAVIGHTYGADPGGGNFILPNLQNRVPVCKGSGTFASLAATGGAETVTLDGNTIPTHTHGVTGGVSGTTGSQSATHQHSYTGVTAYDGSGGLSGGSDYSAKSLTTTDASVGHDHTFSGSFNVTSDSGNGLGGLAHNNLQPYIVLNYIIKT